MDKNVIAVGIFLILVFAMTAAAHYVFVAHEAELPSAHNSGHDNDNHHEAPHEAPHGSAPENTHDAPQGH